MWYVLLLTLIIIKNVLSATRIYFVIFYKTTVFMAVEEKYEIRTYVLEIGIDS